MNAKLIVADVAIFMHSWLSHWMVGNPFKFCNVIRLYLSNLRSTKVAKDDTVTGGSNSYTHHNFVNILYASDTVQIMLFSGKLIWYFWTLPKSVNLITILQSSTQRWHSFHIYHWWCDDARNANKMYRFSLNRFHFVIIFKSAWKIYTRPKCVNFD